MTPPRAVIIAGGRGERLGGVRKADLRIAGTRQLERIIASLGPTTPPLMVATGPRAQRLAIPSGCLAIPDLESPCAGPLAGLVAAVRHLTDSGTTDGLLVSVAVDTAFLPHDFVARMIAGMGAAPVAYAAWGEDFYPPNAVWQLASLQDLPNRLGTARAPASLKALQRSLGAQRVDWVACKTANPFANINTLADLLAVQRSAVL